MSILSEILTVKIGLKAPNAVASIRGTEWIYEVDVNQVSSMAVVEGLFEHCRFEWCPITSSDSLET